MKSLDFNWFVLFAHRSRWPNLPDSKAAFVGILEQTKWFARLPMLVAQLDDLLHCYLDFCADHLYFKIQISESYRRALYQAARCFRLRSNPVCRCFLPPDEPLLTASSHRQPNKGSEKQYLYKCMHGPPKLTIKKYVYLMN